jgi:ABC-2 type transport system permease protein
MTTLTRPRETVPHQAPTAGTALTGTGRLLRFGLRRDRVRILVWALSIGGLIGYFGAAIPVVYPDAAAMQTRAEIMKDPSGAFMTGPGYGLDEYTFGVMIANEMLGMVAVAVALMSVFLVVRHTRAALLASDLALPDSLAIAVGAAMVGLVFGSVAAVTAQLSEHARTASGMAGGLLGLAYVVRGVGDAAQPGGSTLSWMSPIGWAQQTRAFVDLRWWPLLLAAALSAALLVAAFALVGHRDVGAGLVPARRGRPAAARWLLSPAGLTWRTERATILWWAVGLLVFAVLTGSMAQGIVDSFESQPQLAEVFGGADQNDVLRSTLAAFLAFFAMAVAVYAVVAVNRLNREEDEGRTAAILATAVGRPAWLGGSLLVAVLGSAALLLVSGLGLGAGAASAVGDPGLVGEFTVAALAYLPIVLCFMGLAAVAHGLHAGTWWVWVLLVVSIIVGLYGPLFNLPDPVLDAAPFSLIPRAPSEALVAAPLVLLTAVAGALMVMAAASLSRRDLTA